MKQVPDLCAALLLYLWLIGLASIVVIALYGVSVYGTVRQAVGVTRRNENGWTKGHVWLDRNGNVTGGRYRPNSSILSGGAVMLISCVVHRYHSISGRMC